MTNGCNICWENDHKLYRVCHACNPGKTCTRCIRQSVLYQGNKFRCLNCRDPVKVPGRLLHKYELGLCIRLILLVGFLLSDLALKLSLAWYGLKLRFDHHHTTVLFSSLIGALTANTLFYYKYTYYLWGFNKVFDRTFFLSNLLVLLAFTVYYCVFVSRFRIKKYKLVVLFTSTGMVMLTPHLMTSTMVIVSGMGYNVVYGLASVSVLLLAVGFVVGLVLLLFHGAQRWGETGYRHALNRFIGKN